MADQALAQVIDIIFVNWYKSQTVKKDWYIFRNIDVYQTNQTDKKIKDRSKLNKKQPELFENSIKMTFCFL